MSREKMISMDFSTKILLVSLSTLIALFLCDWALGLLGFSSELPMKVSHPKNFHEIRRNIEFRYEFRTNDQGLRYRELALKKTPGSYRIFVVGDSFTEGDGVDADQRFTDLLERSYDRSDRPIFFINGGLSGTGPLEYGRLLLHVGLRYNPDGVLICVYANDVANTPASATESSLYGSSSSRSGVKKLVHSLWPRAYTLLNKYKLDEEYRQKLGTRDFISTASRKAREQGISSERIDIWKASLPQELVLAVNRGEFTGAILLNGLIYPEYWIDSIDIRTRTGEEKWTNMVRILSNVIDLCRQRGIEVAIVFIPCVFQYDPASHDATNPWVQTGTLVKKEWLSEKTEVQARLESWTRGLDVPFLDLTPTFREALRFNRDLNWTLDDHWRPLGHKVAARAIAEWLADKHVFSFIGPSSLAVR